VRIPNGADIEVYKNRTLVCSIKSEVEINSIPILDDEEKEGLKELVNRHLETKSKICDGVASSFYGLSNVGSSLHRCKYEGGGDFPDFLLKLTLKAFRKTCGKAQFDLLLYVPPTISGDLVKNFASRISEILKIPISHKLIKERATNPQKIYQNAYLKKENIAMAFTYSMADEIKGKRILLIDDIYDSGATIKEIGKLLTNLGAKLIVPLVIARTVGGDIKND